MGASDDLRVRAPKEVRERKENPRLSQGAGKRPEPHRSRNMDTEGPAGDTQMHSKDLRAAEEKLSAIQ